MSKATWRVHSLNEDIEVLMENMIDEETGEIEIDIMDMFTDAKIDINTALVDCMREVKNLEIISKNQQAEIKELYSSIRIKENNITKIKTFVTEYMEIHNLKKVESGTNSVTCQNKPDSVEVFDEKSIPFSIQIHNSERPENPPETLILKKVKDPSLIPIKTAIKLFMQNMMDRLEKKETKNIREFTTSEIPGAKLRVNRKMTVMRKL